MSTRPLFCAVAAFTLLIGGCGVSQEDNEILVQRIFGACAAEYGANTDVSAAHGECGIITSLLNKFAKENPDLRIEVSTVAWPGYDQLSAQLAAGDAPDLVTMHASALADYQSRDLLEPIGEELRAAGVDPATFTEAGLKGVTTAGRIYGMPFDTWAPLWHINLNLFEQAGLMENGEPIIPRTPEELLDHARRFTRATGKPYFVQPLANELAMPARNLYTFLMQQNADFFADPRQIKLRTPEAKRVLELFRTMYAEGLTTRNQDYSASLSAFLNGGGAVYLGGTWVIGEFVAQSKLSGRPLSEGYTVMTYPQLYPGRHATFADAHTWVVPVKERTATQRQAIFRLLKFLADHNDEWARTGHLPAFKSVIESERFLALPHRQDIAELATIGTPLPDGVQRQFAVQEIVSEEMFPAIAGQKSIDAALADAERRVNELLFHVL